MSKPNKKRADKYDEKLAIDGSFEDVIGASVSPTFTRIDTAKVPTENRLFEVSVFQGMDSLEIRTYELIDDHPKLLFQLTKRIPLTEGESFTSDLYKETFEKAQQTAQNIEIMLG